MARTMKQTGRRPDIEADLTEKYHVSWEYVEGVSPSQFDVDNSLKNQARFEPVHEETVAEYAEAMERGDLFPAVVAARRRKGGKLVIIDGNHRLVAATQVGYPLSVYEVETGTRPQVVQLMTYAFNTRHGRPTSEEERVQQALYLIDNGASLADAAAAVNVADRVVKRELNKRNAQERAVSAGVDIREWEALTQSAKSRLLNVSTDEGLKDAVHVSFVAGLDANEVFQLVADLNATGRSATKQRAFLRAKLTEYADRIQAGMGGVINGQTNRRAVTPKARVGMVLGNLAALPDDAGVLARAYGEAEVGDLIPLLDSSIGKLSALREALHAR